MARILRGVLSLIVVLGMASAALSEDSGPFPQITFAQSGAKNLLEDLKYIMMLTEAQEQRQWQILEEYLDIFLIGIDQTRPIRIDLLLGGKTIRYRPSFPITSIKEFRKENLDSLGVETRPRVGTLFTCKEAFVGHMRYKHKYATFGELRTDLPVNAPDPSLAIRPLVDKYDLAFDGRNNESGQDAQAERRKSFQETRTELLAGIKKTKGESVDDFVVRKQAFITLLDEFERLYVELSHLQLGWNTDAVRNQGNLEIDLEPIEGTSLDEAIQVIGQKPSHFSKVERSEDSILSGHLNLPLDELRRNNFLALLKLMRTKARNETNASTELRDSEKTSRLTIITLAFEMLEAGTKASLADGFVEVRANKSGNNTLVGGITAVNGNKVVEILELLPKAGKDQNVEIDVAREGDVRIHKVLISKMRHANFKGFFGEEYLYIGSCEDAVWYAAGENSVDELKAAIKKSGVPAEDGDADDRFLDLFVKLGPWIDLRVKRKVGQKDDSSVLNMRRLAIEAFKLGDDTITTQLNRVDDRVTGRMVANPGILRFVGKLIADFSKENLDDGATAKN